MCGIAGVLSFDRRAGDRELLARMNGALVHRGPDDEGYLSDETVGLAMRRLSIIGVANGHQPIFNEDRSIALVMNGEIYNYQQLKSELRARGHEFRTESDAETVVHLYEEVGDDVPSHLRGMFGFALYDRRRGKLLLARDRAGQKPLYYAPLDDGLAFGSEIKAIHASGLVDKEMDTGSLASYLAFGFVVGEETLFRGVRKLPPGCVLTAQDGEVEVRRYWDFPRAGERDLPFEEAAERLQELLREAVRVRLMSEVPLGAFLSGGIDSSTVVALMCQELGRPVQTFSVGFDDARLDELEYARAVAESLGTRHHEVSVANCDADLMRRMNWHQDEPAGDPASVPTFCLSEFARRHITVALTGEGADEVFAGYPHYQLCRRMEALERRVPLLSPVAGWLERAVGLTGSLAGPRVQKALWLMGLDPLERARGWISAFTDRELRQLANGHLAPDEPESAFEAGRQLLRRRSDASSSLAATLIVDTRLTLADHLLMKVDKMSMATSLEARSPLLDHELVEFACSLPTEMKISPEGTKLVLRRAVRDLIPPEILTRPKRGFDVPIRRWLFRDLEELVERQVLAHDSPVAEYLDIERVRGLWRRLQKTDNSRLEMQFWRILNFGVWHELHWPRSGSAEEPAS